MTDDANETKLKFQCVIGNIFFPESWKKLDIHILKQILLLVTCVLDVWAVHVRWYVRQKQQMDYLFLCREKGLTKSKGNRGSLLLQCWLEMRNKVPLCPAVGCLKECHPVLKAPVSEPKDLFLGPELCHRLWTTLGMLLQCSATLLFCM